MFSLFYFWWWLQLCLFFFAVSHLFSYLRALEKLIVFWPWLFLPHVLLADHVCAALDFDVAGHAAKYLAIYNWLMAVGWWAKTKKKKKRIECWIIGAKIPSLLLPNRASRQGVCRESLSINHSRQDLFRAMPKPIWQEKKKRDNDKLKLKPRDRQKLQRIYGESQININNNKNKIFL